MRVLIDAFPLLAPRSGVGNYTWFLAKALRKEFPEDSFVYFYGRRFSKEILEAAPSFDAGLKLTLKKLLPYPYRLTQPIKEAFFRLGAPKQKADIYHEMNYVPLPYAGPQVTTVFDMSLIRYPETHPKDRRAYFESYFKKRLPQSDHFITISDFSKRELSELYDVPPEKITTVYLGGLEEVPPLCGPEPETPERYFLYCGNLEPRKNLPMLLRAYAAAKRRDRSLPKLLFVGSPSWLAEEFFETLKKEDLEDNVVIKGFVPAAELPCYYKKALAFLFPSRYEGFGLPVLEAMQMGVPVVTSDCASLPEVAGNAGITLPPDDVEGWSEALLLLSGDETKRADMSRKSLERADLFSWAKCARETRSVYEKVLSLYF